MGLTYGTNHFVNFTKACDYYKDQGYDYSTPAALERVIRAKIEDGEIALGKPEVPVGARLLLVDNGTRYAIEEN